MLNPVSASKIRPSSVPKVLLQAKKEAAMQTSGKGKPWDKAWDKAWDKGPWDKGHWANRK